jgi:hypothetical protein
MLRRASSTISIHGTMLVSTVTPTPSPVIFPPSSPTIPTLAFLPRGVDTDRPAITTVEAEARSRFSQPFNHDGLSPVVPLTGRGAQPSPVPCTQPGSVSNHSPLSCIRPTSQAPGAPVSVVLDAATRLQDFRTLIAEMRAALFHHYDFEEEFDAVNRDHDDDDEEKERLLRLLEDVMRIVKHLAEKDAAGFGRSVTKIDAPVSSVQCSLGPSPPYCQMFPSYYPMN